MKIDHVLYAVPNLDDAAARFERDHGLTSYAGGSHPVFGTGNRIVPLGEAYIELIAVVDPATASANPVGSLVGSLARTGGGWLGWVAQVEDIDAHAARVGSVVIPGHRIRPDGVTVSWRAAGMERMLEHRGYPFFIAWDDPSVHPGLAATTAPPLSIVVGADQDGLRTWLGGLPSWLSVIEGALGLTRVSLGDRVIA